MKLFNFEYWCSGDLSKSAKSLLSKSIFYVKNHSNLSDFFYQIQILYPSLENLTTRTRIMHVYQGRGVFTNILRTPVGYVQGLGKTPLKPKGC